MNHKPHICVFAFWILITANFAERPLTAAPRKMCEDSLRNADIFIRAKKATRKTVKIPNVVSRNDLIMSWQAALQDDQESLEIIKARLSRSTERIALASLLNTENESVSLVEQLVGILKAKTDDDFRKLEQITRVIDLDVLRAELEALNLLENQIDDFIALVSGLDNYEVIEDPLSGVLLGPEADRYPDEAFNPKFLPIPMEIREVILEFLRAGDSSTSELTKVERTSDVKKLRAWLVTMMKDQYWQDRLYEAALANLKGVSDVSISLAPTNSNTIEDVDVLIIGSGILEATMRNYLAQAQSNFRILTWEESDRPISTFADAGYVFNLNSTRKPEDKGALRQQFRKADLNFIPGGYVQVNQFVRERHPTAADFARAHTINRAFAGGELRLGTEIVSGSLEVDGRIIAVDQNGLKVRARLVINAGTGEEDIPEALSKVYKQAQRRAKPGELPQIATFQQFVRFIARNKNPMRMFSDEVVAVGGPGDGGKAVVRFLMHEADPRAYGDDTRSVPGPKLILWHGQPCKDCAQFIQANRAFYYPLAAGFTSQLIIPKPKVAKAELSTKGPSAVSVFDVENPSRRPGKAKFLILSLGFKEIISRIYGKIIGPIEETKNFMNSDRHFSTIFGYEASLGIVGFARRLLDSQQNPTNVIVIGPTTGTAIINDDEVEGIPQNRVSYAVHSWRAYRLAEAVQTWLDQVYDEEDGVLTDAPVVATPKTLKPNTTVDIDLSGMPIEKALELVQEIEQINRSVRRPRSRQGSLTRLNSSRLRIKRPRFGTKGV